MTKRAIDKSSITLRPTLYNEDMKDSTIYSIFVKRKASQPAGNTQAVNLK